MADTTKNTMVADMIEVQKNLPHIKKASKANYGSYASLDLIHDKVLPVITEHHFAWVTLPSVSETGDPTLKYSLMHVSGAEIAGEMKLYLGKQDAQGQGSAITYAKRYAICAVLGLTPDDDDDGQAAVKPPIRSDYKSPEEPSRNVNDVPILDLSKEVLKQAIANSGRFKSKTDVTAFYYDELQKDAPTTEADVEKLLKALEEPF